MNLILTKCKQPLEDLILDKFSSRMTSVKTRKGAQKAISLTPCCPQTSQYLNFLTQMFIHQSGSVMLILVRNIDILMLQANMQRRISNHKGSHRQTHQEHAHARPSREAQWVSLCFSPWQKRCHFPPQLQILKLFYLFFFFKKPPIVRTMVQYISIFTYVEAE